MRRSIASGSSRPGSTTSSSSACSRENSRTFRFSESVRAIMDTNGENATLTFNGTAGQRVSLNMTAVTIGTSQCCSAKVSIQKPDATNLVAPTFEGLRGGFFDTKTLPVTGKYKILVD